MSKIRIQMRVMVDQNVAPLIMALEGIPHIIVNVFNSTDLTSIYVKFEYVGPNRLAFFDTFGVLMVEANCGGNFVLTWTADGRAIGKLECRLEDLGAVCKAIRLITRNKEMEQLFSE